jgi:hypothetical protein
MVCLTSTNDGIAPKAGKEKDSNQRRLFQPRDPDSDTPPTNLRQRSVVGSYRAYVSLKTLRGALLQRL